MAHEQILKYFSDKNVGRKNEFEFTAHKMNYEREDKMVKLAVIRRSTVKKDLPNLPERVFYRYAPKPGAKFDGGGIIDGRSREFCVEMVRLDKVYTKEEIARISFQLRYSVFNYAGSYGCRHRWEKVILTERPKDEKPRVGKKYYNDI